MQNQETKTPYVPRIKPVDTTTKGQKIANKLKQGGQAIASHAKGTVAEKFSGGLKQAFNDWVEHKPGARSVLIPCEKLRFDHNQPFRMYNDEEIDDLAARIKQSGLLNPIIVRKNSQGAYEILSGRNRAKAVMKLGHKEIAAFIAGVNDDEAKRIMLNANLGQRHNLLPSEKAKAYNMELALMNRENKNLGKKCPNYDARQIIGERYDESKRNVSYYLRLNYLHHDLLNLVDDKKLTVLTGVELSYLNYNEQEIILKDYIEKGRNPNAAQITAFKKLSKEKKLNRQTAEAIMNKSKSSKQPKEYIKFDKSKFSQFTDIINNTPNLEQLFIEFLKSRNRNSSLNNLQNGGGTHAAQPKGS
jgi:ParB family chromosome partitioning protein